MPVWRNLVYRARLGEFGYVCVNCSNCKASQIKKEAETLGYHVFIVPGGSMVAKIVKRLKPKAVMGVACMKELVMALEGLSMPIQSVELLRDGCVDTDVEMEKVQDILSVNKRGI